jgi:hypothetical protein
MNRYLGLILGLAITLLIAACGGDDDDATTAPSDDEVVTAVNRALHEKHGLEPGTLEVTLSTIVDGKYASGGARDEGSAGMWFAALVDGEWRIVWDGNGVIDCPSVDPYPDFPASMIPACFATDGTLTQR